MVASTSRIGLAKATLQVSDFGLASFSLPLEFVHFLSLSRELWILLLVLWSFSSHVASESCKVVFDDLFHVCDLAVLRDERHTILEVLSCNLQLLLYVVGLRIGKKDVGLVFSYGKMCGVAVRMAESTHSCVSAR